MISGFWFGSSSTTTFSAASSAAKPSESDTLYVIVYVPIGVELETTSPPITISPVISPSSGSLAVANESASKSSPTVIVVVVADSVISGFWFGASTSSNTAHTGTTLFAESVFG